MNTFTKAACRHYVRHWGQEGYSVCREWLALKLDRDRLERDLGLQLYQDLQESFPPHGAEQPECAVVDAFMKEGFARVNWRTVARYLLERFVPELPAAAREGVGFSVN